MLLKPSGSSDWSEPSSAAGSILALTLTLTTAGETRSTTSAKPGTCGASTRTASARTGAVPVATAPKPMAPAMASEAAAANSRLRVREYELGAIDMDLVSSFHWMRLRQSILRQEE